MASVASAPNTCTIDGANGQHTALMVTPITAASHRPSMPRRIACARFPAAELPRHGRGWCRTRGRRRGRPARRAPCRPARARRAPDRGEVADDDGVGEQEERLGDQGAEGGYGEAEDLPVADPAGTVAPAGLVVCDCPPSVFHVCPARPCMGAEENFICFTRTWTKLLQLSRASGGWRAGVFHRVCPQVPTRRGRRAAHVYPQHCRQIEVALTGGCETRNLPLRIEVGGAAGARG